ncbi:MAG: (2Fe-2S)-binding protein, partial [Ignavibacteria bacterium]
LKSRPGKINSEPVIDLSDKYIPILHCYQEIPCNPCISVCPSGAIKLQDALGSIMDLPYFDGECSRCGQCIAVCPGLAISVAKKLYGDFAEVVLPHEFIPNFNANEFIPLTDTDGNYLEKGEVIKINYNKKYKTYLVSLKVLAENATKIAGIRIQDEDKTKPLPKAIYNYIPDNAIVCRCERVTLKQVVDFIKENDIHDANQLKQIRVGMGACGSRTCSVMLPRVFSAAGINWYEVTQNTKRPLSVEIPMCVLANEGK